MAGAPDRPGHLRIVTWNIRAAIGPGEPFPAAWWRHVRRDRLERIAAILVELEADVAMLQEVTIMTPDGDVHDQPAELARLTARHLRYAAGHSFALVEPETGRSIGSAMWGNAILSRRPLERGSAIGLPRAADDDLVEPVGAAHPLAGVQYRDAEPGHREPRCVVGGRLDGFAIATTHLTYIGADQRRRQADAARAAVEGAAGTGSFVLTGDLNAGLRAPELAGLRHGLVDAFEAVGIGPDDPSRATCGRQAIDQVLVRGLTVEACRVVVEAGDASDHLPVMVDLSLP